MLTPAAGAKPRRGPRGSGTPSRLKFGKVKK